MKDTWNPEMNLAWSEHRDETHLPGARLCDGSCCIMMLTTARNSNIQILKCFWPSCGAKYCNKEEQLKTSKNTKKRFSLNTSCPAYGTILDEVCQDFRPSLQCGHEDTVRDPPKVSSGLASHIVRDDRCDLGSHAWVNVWLMYQNHKVDHPGCSDREYRRR